MSDEVAAAPPDFTPPAAPMVAADRVDPTVTDLFFGFFKVTITGFGGVLAWARREFVFVRRWMTQDEFNELFALCQFLPGPNIVTFSIVYGARLHGWRGVLAGLSGLMIPPIVLMIVAGTLYSYYGSLPLFSGGLTGLAAAAAGLLISSAVQMAEPMFKRGNIPGIAVAVAAFAGVGFLQLPLLWVLAVLIPVSVALAWRKLA
jgi:chromate transporter